MKHNLKVNFISFLYDRASNYSSAKLRDIARRNKTKHIKPHVLVTALLYKNKIYEIKQLSTYNLVQYRPTVTLPVADSLAEEMEQYIKHYEEIEKERPIASRFMTLVFNFCRSTSDLRYILGNTLFELLDYPGNDFRGESRLQYELDQFITKHSKLIDMLNQRFLDNVLMSDIYNESKN